jgi:O-antigen ligase
LGDAHNTFLSVASQTGFVGFTAFTLLLIFLLRTFLPIRFERQTVIKTGLGFAFVTAFLYQGLAGSFEDARHLWVLIGLMASFGEREQQEENIA